MSAYEFVGTGATRKEVNIGYQLYHSYAEGSFIRPHLHIYIPTDAIGGNIRLYCEYYWSNIGDTGSPTIATLTSDIIRTANQAASLNHIASFGSDVDGLGKTISSIVITRVYRDPSDAADTFGASVWLMSADIHIKKDTEGSRDVLVK